MTDAKSGHFTATLEVHEVRFVEPATSQSYSRSDPKPDPRRETSEVVRLVIRADTLDDLRTKIGAHAALID